LALSSCQASCIACRSFKTPEISTTDFVKKLPTADRTVCSSAQRFWPNCLRNCPTPLATWLSVFQDYRADRTSSTYDHGQDRPSRDKISMRRFWRCGCCGCQIENVALVECSLRCECNQCLSRGCQLHFAARVGVAAQEEVILVCSPLKGGRAGARNVEQCPRFLPPRGFLGTSEQRRNVRKVFDERCDERCARGKIK